MTAVKNLAIDHDEPIVLGPQDSALVFLADRGAFALSIPNNGNVNSAAMLLSSILYRMSNDRAWTKDQLDYMKKLYELEVPDSAVVPLN